MLPKKISQSRDLPHGEVAVVSLAEGGWRHACYQLLLRTAVWELQSRDTGHASWSGRGHGEVVVAMARENQAG